MILSAPHYLLAKGTPITGALASRRRAGGDITKLATRPRLPNHHVPADIAIRIVFDFVAFFHKGNLRPGDWRFPQPNLTIRRKSPGLRRPAATRRSRSSRRTSRSSRRTSRRTRHCSGIVPRVVIARIQREPPPLRGPLPSADPSVARRRSLPPRQPQIQLRQAPQMQPVARDPTQARINIRPVSRICDDFQKRGGLRPQRLPVLTQHPIFDIICQNRPLRQPQRLGLGSGANENANGLLREFFPKGKSLRAVTLVEIQAVQSALNHRPRRILNYLRPCDYYRCMA